MPASLGTGRLEDNCCGRGMAYAERLSRDEDAGVTKDTELAERCLLHVAATRAKRNLFVLSRG